MFFEKLANGLVISRKVWATNSRKRAKPRLNGRFPGSRISAL